MPKLGSSPGSVQVTYLLEDRGKRVSRSTEVTRLSELSEVSGPAPSRSDTLWVHLINPYGRAF
jgi:hypothetical protein